MRQCNQNINKSLALEGNLSLKLIYITHETVRKLGKRNYLITSELIVVMLAGITITSRNGDGKIMQPIRLTCGPLTRIKK